jgi:cytochrome c553
LSSSAARSLAAALLILASNALAAAGNPQEGWKKHGICIGCHGIPGYRTAFPRVYGVPKLGQQYAEYIAAALTEYRAGQRENATMRAIAANLSDQDIADLAAYYSAPDK